MKNTASSANRPFTGAAAASAKTQKDGLFGFKSLPGGNRAISAGFAQNPKLQRYEDLTARLKKLLENEKRNVRYVKTMVATEIEGRNTMEKMLRQCVDDVKAEIAKKRAEYKSSHCKLLSNLIKSNIISVDIRQNKKGRSDERNLTQKERDRIIEVLLS